MIFCAHKCYVCIFFCDQYHYKGYFFIGERLVGKSGKWSWLAGCTHMGNHKHSLVGRLGMRSAPHAVLWHSLAKKHVCFLRSWSDRPWSDITRGRFFSEHALGRVKGHAPVTPMTGFITCQSVEHLYSRDSDAANIFHHKWSQLSILAPAKLTK